MHELDANGIYFSFFVLIDGIIVFAFFMLLQFNFYSYSLFIIDLYS